MGPKMKRSLLALLVLALAALACGGQAAVTPTPGSTPTPFPTPDASAFKSGKTRYGFFPSPPKISLDSVLQLYKDLGDHADFILVQQTVPWADFVDSVDGQSKSRTDLTNQVTLALQNHLQYIFVVDGLDGLNRRNFQGLPSGWQASFADPKVRSAYKNYTLWIVRHFHPHYLGLASEINTYMDVHPDDAPNFLSLYNEIYQAVKAEAPDTQIFVTFQWEELNNLMPQIANGRQPYHINWDEVEAFEPNLDVWVISTYPFVAFKSGDDIPADYYTPLLDETHRDAHGGIPKPLAIGEGGYTSQPTGSTQGTPADQVAYLNAIHKQIGSHLVFWTYLLFNDLDMNSYSWFFLTSGANVLDVFTLGMFTSVGLRNADGTPKPALDVWDSFRKGK